MIKSKLILILIGVILISYSYSVKATSNSYYKLKLDIGEYNSNIKEYISLDYKENIKDYKLNLELNLNKKYYFSEGILVDKTQWDYEDYLISISNNGNRLEWGMTSAPFISSFLSGGDLLGLYLKKDNYQFWHGTVSSSSGFRMNSNEQSGVKWSLGDREFSYLNLKRYEGDNHYLNYNDEYLLKNGIVNLETILGKSDSLLGEAVSLNLMSDFKDTSYNFDLDYQSADFQAIKSQFNYGHGKYKVNLRGYRPLGFYIVEGESAYSENNLDRKSSSITKSWDTSWKLNYYGSVKGIYKLKLSYSLDNTYHTEGRDKTSREDEITMRLSYDARLWDYGFTLKQGNKEYLREDIDLQERSASLYLKYNPISNYRVIFNYDITRKRNNDLKRNYSFLYNYQDRLYNNLNYNLNLKFENKYAMRIDLDQSIDYDLFDNHKLRFGLYLSHYLENNSSLYKRLSVEYKYEF